MKTIKYLFFALFICATTYSQEKETQKYGFEKGDIYFSAALSSRPFEFLNQYIEPSAGYFFNSKFSVGIQGRFLINRNNESQFGIKESFGMGINGRFYFMSKKRFNLFAELAIDSTKEIYKGTRNSFPDESSTLSSTISSGANFFITKNISVFMKAGLWQYNKTIFETGTPEGGTLQIEEKGVRHRIDNIDVSAGILIKF